MISKPNFIVVFLVMTGATDAFAEPETQHSMAIEAMAEIASLGHSTTMSLFTDSTLRITKTGWAIDSLKSRIDFGIDLRRGRIRTWVGDEDASDSEDVGVWVSVGTTTGLAAFARLMFNSTDLGRGFSVGGFIETRVGGLRMSNVQKSILVFRESINWTSAVSIEERLGFQVEWRMMFLRFGGGAGVIVGDDRKSTVPINFFVSVGLQH